MSTRPSIVLDRVLRVLRPLVRLLLKNGVTYTALATALKPVFVEAARRELAERGMATTDSAVTLLCGVHRRDVRTLTQAGVGSQLDAPLPPLGPTGPIGEVIARWMAEAAFNNPDGSPALLERGSADDGQSFDALVASVSSDVRPRAVLDELLRLGVVTEVAQGEKTVLQLQGDGFAPRKGFEEMAQLLAANLHDHAAAASANLLGEANFLEQALYVDEIGEQTVERLRQAARGAWSQAFRSVMREAQRGFDADRRQLPPEQRRQRVRFGVYFYSTGDKP